MSEVECEGVMGDCVRSAVCGAGQSTAEGLLQGSYSPAEPSRPLGQQLTPARGSGGEGKQWGRGSYQSSA